MKKRLRNKWVKALRSGDYKQRKTILHDVSANSYCCLGVLCSVAGEKFDYSGFLRYEFEGRELLEGTSLPISLLKKWEILDQQESVLIDMNDNKGYSFTEIADWIEKNL